MGQIVTDLKQLADCLGKNLDDAIIIMHHILHEMRKSNTHTNDSQCHFLDMSGREKWEDAFQKRFLSHVFVNTDSVLNKAHQVILDAGKLTEKPLHRMVYEINQCQDLGKGLVEWKNPALWKYRNHINLQHLKLRLEATDETAGRVGVVLKVLLNMEDLELIQHIRLILQVQSAFITKYRHKVDIHEANRFTLQDYLNGTDEDLMMYIKIWNIVRKRLVNAHRYNTLKQYYDTDMDMESSISMCLPSDRGKGCCALVFIEYLIELQNGLLHKCRELILPTPVFQQIDAPDVSSKHLVCINLHHDLLPLVLANSQYEATVVSGNTHLAITYNLHVLQRKVEENFILRKRIIKKETIPRMTYPQDVGLGKDCQVLQKSVKQIPLPVTLTQTIDNAALHARKADISEAVRYVTLIIQFLGKIGGSEGEQKICDYAKNELTLPVDETGMIPPSAQFRHCLSLYERLSWHRSLISIQIGQNPFEMVQTADDERGNGVVWRETIKFIKMSDKLEEEVKKALRSLNIEKLQLELNSLMMVGPDLQEDWSLADCLFAYLDGKYDDTDNNWCYQIPEQVLVKHSLQLFKISMKFMAAPKQLSE
uniref:E3 ubiquitin-protein ligase rnf213-alpha-like n=1 Tax=Phallusia mammillata TaxID=59560 RepID=A0A6F9DRW7_9ASCI|nr:E3 ubiquitin-protein ligase rnf213-alpha-like [Phallusia mammillata]